MTHPFHELRERLLRAGVAPRHVRRYLAELSDHLADLTAEEERAGRPPAEAATVALERLGSLDALANAMLEQPRLRSWSAKNPSVAFGALPVVLLAVIWLLAFTILWSGWRIFLPEAESPFIPVQHGAAIVYFGIGRMLYLTSPLLLGWSTAVIAARQRVSPVWPAAGVAIIAWVGGTTQVHANRAIHGVGHISLSFLAGPSVSDLVHGLMQTITIFTLAALPYLVWRLANAKSLRA